MAKLEKLQVLGVASESTQGTAVSATNYIPLVEKPTVKPIAEINQRNNFREAMGRLPFSTGWQYTDVSFKMEILGPSATNTAYAPVDVLLKACGMSVTGGTGGADWTYALATTTVSSMLGNATSATLDWYADGLKHIVQGFVGSFKIVGEAGQTPMMEIAGKGLYTAVTDASLADATFTHNAVIPKMKSAALKVDNATAAYCQKVEFDIANKIEFVPDVSSTGGLAGFRIVDREPKAMVNPEMVSVASYDWWAKYMAGTAISSSSVGLQCIFGNGARNFSTVTAPQVQIADIKYGSRNGVLTAEIDFQLNDSATGNDAFNIVIDNA